MISIDNAIPVARKVLFPIFVWMPAALARLGVLILVS
jgi:hypothetical protein